MGLSAALIAGIHQALRAARRVRGTILSLCAVLGSIVLLSAGSWMGDASASVSAAPTVTLAQVYSGLAEPLYVAQPPDASNRLFIVERGGKVRVAVNGVLQATPFLDVSSLITADSSEQGLLGLA